MKTKTKEYLKSNIVTITLAVLIIVVIFYSGMIGITLEELDISLAVMALLIILNLFYQGTQHESEETKKNIRKIIIILIVILFILFIFDVMAFLGLI